MILKTFGRNLRFLRDIKGVSIEQAAQDLYLSRTQLNKFELGIHSPDLETLVRISQYYNFLNIYRLSVSDITSYLQVA